MPALFRTGICRPLVVALPKQHSVRCLAVRATGLVTLLALGAIAVGLTVGTFTAGVLVLITVMQLFSCSSMFSGIAAHIILRNSCCADII